MAGMSDISWRNFGVPTPGIGGKRANLRGGELAGFSRRRWAKFATSGL